jgi:PBP1b-binding outer membrane lipoprotein LpoB
MLKFKQIALILTVLLLVTGCFRDPKPRNTLKRQKFIEVLTDIHIGEAMYQSKQQINLDSLESKAIYLSVLKKHNVSEEKMVNTTLYYSRHPREYDKIYTEVVSRMGSMTEELKGPPPTSEKNETP